MKINLVDVFNQYASTGWGMRGAEWVRCLYKEARMKYLNTAGWQKGKKWMFFNSCFQIGWVGEGAGVQISLNKKLPILQYMYFLFMLQLSFDKRRIILNNQH